jgi:hypothetical protein
VLEDHDDPETQELVWQLEADTRGRYVQIPSRAWRGPRGAGRVRRVSGGEDLKTKLDKCSWTITTDPSRGFRRAESEARDAWRDFRIVAPASKRASG